MSGSADAVKQLVQPVIEAMGFELVGIDYQSHPGNALLRVYIDTPSGITLEHCHQVSEQVSALLDVEEPLSGHYTLEISSPGIDRPLFEPAHFMRFIGHSVKIHLFAPVDGQKRFKAYLQDADDNEVTLAVDDHIITLNYQQIAKARLNPEIPQRRRQS